MTSGGAVLILFLLGLAWLGVTTVLTVRRGGRGPGEPPASHSRVDPAGFPRPPAQPRQSRGPRRSRLPVARTAAATQTARESRTARRMSFATGARPSPSVGRTSTRLP
jgi:hypothetical protein